MKSVTTKRLSLLAMFIALQIVLSKFLMLQLSGSIRLSIDGVPILLAGIWFGPIAGGVVGALADLLGTVLFPTAGAYYPPLTVAFFLIGFSAGIFAKIVKIKQPMLRAALIVVPSELIGSMLFKSFALSLLVGIPFPDMVAGRALPVCAVMVVDTLLVMLLDRMLGEKALREPLQRHKAASVGKRTTAMSYDDALEYIHNVTWRGSRLGLERTNELLSRIGDPQKKLKFVHVAGTNGKGSTAAMLAKVLFLAGYRTGLYISPFINRFNERMQINGTSISDDELAEITAYLRPHAEAMADHPTEFELITVIAFEYFHRHAADIVMLEVGLGGELDSTNVIDTPELAVITNIGLDHTRELGPTISDIARAKAGIIKPGGDVVIYDRNPEADAVFAAVCLERGARLHIADHSRISNVSASLDELRFRFSLYGELVCGLVGVYQANNAAVAITAVELLRQKNWAITDQHLRDGLRLVRWPARFELLRRSPIFIADGGHNPQGVSAVVVSLNAHFPNRKITFLLGVMADKDVPHMIDQLAPLAQEFITVTPDNPRAMNAADLAALLTESGMTATPADSVPDGVRLAIGRAGEDGVVCALGSLYLLGAVRAELGAN
ncbi:MAG: folate family ECF transporter S component [Clostridiales bacterium]|nr:folate family ECF transporter S component [Clostridiales bacterium]